MSETENANAASSAIIDVHDPIETETETDNEKSDDLAEKDSTATPSPASSEPILNGAGTTPTRAPVGGGVLGVEGGRVILAENSEVVHGWRLTAIMASLMLSIFCVAIDNTIIATAIPRITDSFHTLTDVGWYGSGYLLTTCGCQIIYARFYAFFNVRIVFLSALSLFEIGSLICAVSQSSPVFITGRAVAGLGSAGLYTGASTAIAVVAPVKLRPLLTGLLGGLFGFSSIVAPLLGGLFTESVSWRWCFYINLPIGAVSAAGVLWLLHVKQNLQPLDGSILQNLARFDPIGSAIFFSAVVCVLLACQLGGVTYPYSNARIIALFTLFGVLLVALVLWETWNKKNALIPAHLAKRRTIFFGSFFGFSVGSSIFIVAYYLPIWFQAIQGVDPILSAVHTLPMILSQLLGTISAGILTNVIGHYMVFVYGCVVLAPIGTGLLKTLSPSTHAGRWIGYQIITGLGFGFGFQQGLVSVSISLKNEDIPTGGAMVFSALFLGGAIFLNVAQNLFTNRLIKNVEALNLPGLSSQAVVSVGATGIRKLVSPAELPRVVEAYNNAINHAQLASVIMASLAVFGAAGMEWVNVKGRLLAPSCEPEDPKEEQPSAT